VDSGFQVYIVLNRPVPLLQYRNRYISRCEKLTNVRIVIAEWAKMRKSTKVLSYNQGIYVSALI